MKYLILCTLIFIVGCGLPFLEYRGDKKPAPDEGNVNTSNKLDINQSVRSKTRITIEPAPDGVVKDTVVEIAGDVIKAPPRARLTIDMTNDWDKAEQDWYSLFGSYKMSRGMSTLVASGGFMLAGAAVLFVFGLWKPGVGAGAAGLMLLVCGVAVDKYPWVFLIIIVCALIAVAYLVYRMICGSKHNLTLGAVVKQIDIAKMIDSEFVRKNITDPLAQDTKAKTISNYVRKARR